MHREQSVNVLQLIPMVLATMLVTVGLAMFLSNASDMGEVVRSVIVVFGGAAAGLLLSFSATQIVQALQFALDRGIYGGNSPRAMLRAMLKLCEISRREGLLGVAEVQTNSAELEEICQLIGDAAEESTIRFALERHNARERVKHQITSDVFVFTAIYASLFGVLATLLRYVNNSSAALTGGTFLPFVCGASLSIMMVILIARLRTAHLKEVVIADIGYRGAAIILEDNNVQRLHGRLAACVPQGLLR